MWLVFGTVGLAHVCCHGTGVERSSIDQSIYIYTDGAFLPAPPPRAMPRVVVCATLMATVDALTRRTPVADAPPSPPPPQVASALAHWGYTWRPTVVAHVDVGTGRYDAYALTHVPPAPPVLTLVAVTHPAVTVGDSATAHRRRTALRAAMRVVARAVPHVVCAVRGVDVAHEAGGLRRVAVDGPAVGAAGV